jgi:polysaccharide export outer membrane protein
MSHPSWTLIIAAILLLFGSNGAAQQQPSKKADSDRKHIPISIEEILRQQAAGANASQQKDGTHDLNDRLRSLSAVSRYSQDYLLGPGDIIEVTVFGIEDLKRKELTLDSLGKVSLPFINQVQLLGLTPRESEVKIATLFEASVMKNPQISIGVKEYKSQFINVLGTVLKPGPYQLTRRAFLVDALAMAGGLVPEKADTRVFVHRAGSTATAGEQNETIEIDLVQLLDKGDISLNVPIYAGDVISVPERTERFYYVLVDVNRGGAFEMKRSEKMTLSRALASAGGLMPTANSSKAKVIRQRADGSASIQISVNVKKILKGESEDILLSQNDVVFVPGSTTKTISNGLVNSIGSILGPLVYVGIR